MTDPATDLSGRPAGGTDTVEAAVVAAEQAARRAGVTVRQLASREDHAAVRAVFLNIWRPDPANPPVTGELLTALAKAGNHVAGAFAGPDLVGACVGFFGPPAERSMHSHIAGVSAAARGRNVGFALKVYQRAWAMRHGVSTISWTFDPLVRRNAHFNVVKLAATPEAYLPNLYGGMLDAINSGDESDRLLVRWRLELPAVAAACAAARPAGGGTDTAHRADTAGGTGEGAVVGLTVGADGGPVTGRRDAPTVLVAVPPDVEELRTRDPGLARAWRLALREVLGALLDRGGLITDFDPAGRYVVRVAGRTREGSR